MSSFNLHYIYFISRYLIVILLLFYFFATHLLMELCFWFWDYTNCVELQYAVPHSCFSSFSTGDLSPYMILLCCSCRTFHCIIKYFSCKPYSNNTRPTFTRLFSRWVLLSGGGFSATLRPGVETAPPRCHMVLAQRNLQRCPSFFFFLFRRIVEHDCHLRVILMHYLRRCSLNWITKTDFEIFNFHNIYAKCHRYFLFITRIFSSYFFVTRFNYFTHHVSTSRVIYFNITAVYVVRSRFDDSGNIRNQTRVRLFTSTWRAHVMF